MTPQVVSTLHSYRQRLSMGCFLAASMSHPEAAEKAHVLYSIARWASGKRWFLNSGLREG